MSLRKNLKPLLPPFPFSKIRVRSRVAFTVASTLALCVHRLSGPQYQFSLLFPVTIKTMVERSLQLYFYIVPPLRKSIQAAIFAVDTASLWCSES